ncbi:MAG: type IV secretion system protein [Alphaproteobacteria bacterium]|nr:type IV secretion system protein [Alphaproteobacteria bacterium]
MIITAGKSAHLRLFMIGLVILGWMVGFHSRNAYAVDTHMNAYAPYVCPYARDVEEVLKQQVQLDEDTYTQSEKSFFTWNNDGAGVGAFPDPIWAHGDGSEFKIKMVDWDGTYSWCLQDTANIANKRSAEDSTMRICYRREHEECETIKNGDCAVVMALNFCVKQTGDQLCIDASLLGLPIMVGKQGCIDLGKTAWPGAMCREAKDNLDKGQKLDNCVCFPTWVSPACYGSWYNGIPGMKDYVGTGDGKVDDRTPLGKYVTGKFFFSGPVVQCVHDTVRTLFYKEQKGCVGRQITGFTMFYQIKEALRKAVIAALTLSVILYFMDMLIKGGKSPGDALLYVVKIALVTWFAVGNGVETFYDAFIEIGQKLAGMILSSGGRFNSQMCAFTDALKPGGQYSFITDSTIRDYAIWVELDCKVFNYFGGNLFESIFQDSSFMFIILSVILVIAMYVVVGILLLLMFILFAVVLLSIFVRFVHIYILTVIGATFIIFFAPIFVPLSLFQATRGYFDAWLSQVFSFILMPLVLFAFISMFMNAMDQVVYGDITEYPNMFNADGTINADPDPDDDDKYMCDDHALGCLAVIVMNQAEDYAQAIQDGTVATSGALAPFMTDIIGFILITGYIGAILIFSLVFNSPNVAIYNKLLAAMLKASLVGVLFYIFLGIVVGLAAEASGNTSLTGLAKGAIDLIKIGLDAAKAVIGKAMGVLSKNPVGKIGNQVMRDSGVGEGIGELQSAADIEGYTQSTQLRDIASVTGAFKQETADSFTEDDKSGSQEGGDQEVKREQQQEEQSDDGVKDTADLAEKTVGGNSDNENPDENKDTKTGAGLSDDIDTAESDIGSPSLGMGDNKSTPGVNQ